ncbi:MAG TPA: hypothetical protein VGQ59_15480 [Cyclobacteriaceae bacterium]|jgi:hypothetical protein|nr:hypothetical protein [Cyclobacteriaceae bacterium]
MARLLFVLFTFSSIALSAQKYFLPGYYISSAGDTVRGFIDFSKKNAKQCVFQKKEGDEIMMYTPKEIRGYGFNGDKQFAVKKLPSDSSLDRAVFMEILVQGKVNLYRNNDVFYIEKDKLYVLEMETVQDQQSVRYKKKYVGILNLLFSDCQGLPKDAANVSYSQKDLVEITARYNRCVNAKYTVFKRKKAHLSANFYLMGGINSSSLLFGPGNYTYVLSKGKVKMNDVSPSFGAGILMTHPGVAENLSLSLEVHYSQEKYNGSDSEVLAAYTQYDNYSINGTRLKFPLGIKYNFLSGPNSLYLRAGMCLNLFLNNTISATQRKEYVDGSVTYSSSNTGFDNWHLGQFWASLGYQFKLGGIKGFTELRGESLIWSYNSDVYIDNSSLMIMTSKFSEAPTLSFLFGVIF